MTPREAVRWHELGVAPHDAARRRLAGERPRRVSWLSRLAVPEPELDPGRTLALRRLLRAGVPADVARAYADAGWDGGEAEPWARRRVDRGTRGCSGRSGSALRRPHEPGAGGGGAGRVVGRRPFAGGGGLVCGGVHAEEATAQRAAGVSGSQAAVLRALSALDPGPGAD